MTTNSGTLQNTFNYLVPAAGTTRGYRVTKEFVPGQIEVCDFRNMALDGVSFVPSGVLIDNTRGTDNCVVTILEYSWRIVIPAGQFAHMPYPAPYNQTATIEGNAPELTVVFVDYPVIPFFQNSNSGGGSVGGITDINAGDGISIDKTNPTVPIISATGGGGGDSEKVVTLMGMLYVSETSTNESMAVQLKYDPDGLWDGSKITLPAGLEYFNIEINYTPQGVVESVISCSNNVGSAIFGAANFFGDGASNTTSATFFGALLGQLDGVFEPKFGVRSSTTTGTMTYIVTVNIRIK